MTNAAASVRLSETKFRLAPYQTKWIVASFQPPRGLDATTFPVYSGFIQIQSKQDITHVSYLGVAASMKDKQVVDNTDGYFGVQLPLLLDGTGGIQTESTNYTFVDADYPTLLYR